MDEQELSELIEKVERESANFGLKLNRQKTKLVLIECTSKVEGLPDIRDVEIVDDIIYLGTHINKDGNASIEIKRRIALAKTAITTLNKIWRDKHITPTTKRRLV